VPSIAKRNNKDKKEYENLNFLDREKLSQILPSSQRAGQVIFHSFKHCRTPKRFTTDALPQNRRHLNKHNAHPDINRMISSSPVKLSGKHRHTGLFAQINNKKGKNTVIFIRCH
jgi:hypothetical protein